MQTLCTSPGASPPLRSTRLRRAVVAAALGLLAGCSSLSPDGAMAPVQAYVRPHLPSALAPARSETDLDRLAPRVAALLAEPLTATAAVELALLNNRGLQARMQALGITEAEVVQASTLPNPSIRFGRVHTGDERETEVGLHLGLARLLVLPLLRPVQARRLQQAQIELALAVLALAAETRKAYVQAVAAQQSREYLQQALQAAQAGAELARRMAAVGNFNRLQRAREQAFEAQAALDVARAEQARLASREKLTRLLGLWGMQTQFVLPDRLPELPAEPAEQPDIERRAMTQRLDVQRARLAAEQTAHNLGLTRSTRLVNVLEAGFERSTSNQGPSSRAWEVSLELPLFDWGQARLARAQAVYMQALHQAADTAIQARSEVRQAYGHWRLAWDVARHHRDTLLPLHRQIADENLLRYNGMLIGVFELLADARQQVRAVNAAIEAQRDFWLAQADLDMALIGRPSLDAPAASLPAAPADGAAH